MLPTAAQIAAAVPHCPLSRARSIIGPLRETCTLFSINTGPRIAAFLAQCGHESASFTRTRENLNYSAEGLMRTWPARFPKALAQQVARKPEHIANIAYGGRMGNVHEGDGHRFLGRGWIQVTGRANYESITQLLLARLAQVPDFTLHPELLEQPRWAALSAGAWWDDHELNALADSGDMDRMTRIINGGRHGIEHRKARYAQAKVVFGS
jgi:putative chitinase